MMLKWLSKLFDSEDHIRMMECVVKWFLNRINLNKFKSNEKEEEEEKTYKIQNTKQCSTVGAQAKQTSACIA